MCQHCCCVISPTALVWLVWFVSLGETAKTKMQPVVNWALLDINILPLKTLHYALGTWLYIVTAEVKLRTD